MTLYEINEKLTNMVENSIDLETGEILFTDEDIEALQMERDEKIENIVLYIKNQDAFGKALREEEKVLAARRKTIENRVERLKEYLTRQLAGEKFATTKCAISFRKSVSPEFDEDFIGWAKDFGEQYLRYKEPEVNKTEVGKALKQGIEVPHARLEEHLNIQIK